MGILHALLGRSIRPIPRLWEVYILVFFALFFRCPICPFWRLIISEQMRRVSLFFLCSFCVLALVSLSLSALKMRHFCGILSLLFLCFCLASLFRLCFVSLGYFSFSAPEK